MPLSKRRDITRNPVHFLYIFTGRNEVVAKVIFLHLFVILFTGGVSASVHAGIPHTPTVSRHPRSRHPPDQTPPEQTLPRADTPRSRHPPEQTAPGKQTPPRADTPPPRADIPPGADTLPPQRQTPPWEADSDIRSMSDRYPSYWNAFLS